jgi:ATP-dependent DNA ligase
MQHIETHGEALFRAIAADDHEGIGAKRADAPYRAGPQAAWLKIKNREYSRRDAVEWKGRRLSSLPRGQQAAEK